MKVHLAPNDRREVTLLFSLRGVFACRHDSRMRIPRLREAPDQPDAPRTETFLPSLYRIRSYTPIYTGLGIGFAIDAAGTLVTCEHVISKAFRIEAIAWDGARHEARAVSASPERDLAALKIDAVTKPLPFCGEGREADCAWVWLARHPNGNIGPLEKGIVERRRQWREISGLQLRLQGRRGDSGNPVLNGSGQVVGMLCAGSSSFPLRILAVDAAGIRRFIAEAMAREAEAARALNPANLTEPIQPRPLPPLSGGSGKTAPGTAAKAYASGQTGSEQGQWVNVLYQSDPPRPSFRDELVIEGGGEDGDDR